MGDVLSPLEAVSNVGFGLAVVLGVLWARTPAHQTYETVDRVEMKVKTALLYCTLILLGVGIYARSQIP